MTGRVKQVTVFVYNNMKFLLFFIIHAFLYYYVIFSSVISNSYSMVPWTVPRTRAQPKGEDCSWHNFQGNHTPRANYKILAILWQLTPTTLWRFCTRWDIFIVNEPYQLIVCIHSGSTCILTHEHFIALFSLFQKAISKKPQTKQGMVHIPISGKTTEILPQRNFLNGSIYFATYFTLMNPYHFICFCLLIHYEILKCRRTLRVHGLAW